MSSPGPGWFRGVLAAARSLTPTSRSLVFTVEGWPGNEAGQHADIRLTAPDGYQAVRSYSIASEGPAPEVEFAVDRLPDGEVSPFLVDDLEIGDPVELRGPLGGWFVWRPEQRQPGQQGQPGQPVQPVQPGQQGQPGQPVQPVQLIAGGSGVVPFVAMSRAHARAASTAPMRLLYSLRTPADALFREELARPSATIETTWHYTRTTPPEWPRPAGRLRAEDLERETLPPSVDPLIYICGPTGFVESVSRIMIDLGHADDRIRTERFGGI